MAKDRVVEFTPEHKERFFTLLFDRMGVIPVEKVANIWKTLEAAYSEPHRHYHTAEHIVECLDLFDMEWVHKAACLYSPCNFLMRDEMEAAIWWHDVVYSVTPTALSNEEASASWAFAELRLHSGKTNPASLVHLYILDTDHSKPAKGGYVSALVRDIDMAILGSSPKRFEQYSEQIREEYSGVPLHDYLKGRRDFLQKVLDASSIYITESFRERFEDQARRNLNHAVHRLNMFLREE